MQPVVIGKWANSGGGGNNSHGRAVQWRGEMRESGQLDAVI